MSMAATVLELAGGDAGGDGAGAGEGEADAEAALNVKGAVVA